MENFDKIKKNLKKVFLFSDLDDSELEVICGFASIRNYSKGEQVFIEGTLSREFYIVLSGRVKIYKLSSNGDEHILHVHAQNELLAEASIFDLKIYPAFCSALEDSVLICISNDKFTAMVEKNPQIAVKLLSSYSRRLRGFVAKIADLSFRNVKSRLAKFILDNCDGSGTCTLSFSKKELAALLGTIPETLSRTFDYLKKEGMITEKNQILEIIDKNKLNFLADL